MSKNIPMYGQNKDGGSLGAIGDIVKVFEFNIAVADSGNANNADTGVDFPANFVPLYSVAENAGSTALAGNACALDVGGTDIIADVDALAAGAKVVLMLHTYAGVTSATDILIDGSSGLVTGSGSTTLNVKVVGIDTSAANIDELASI